MIKKPTKKAAPAKTKKAMPAKKAAPAKKIVSVKKAMPAKKVRKYQEGGLVAVDAMGNPVQQAPLQERLAMDALRQQASQQQIGLTQRTAMPGQADTFPPPSVAIQQYPGFDNPVQQPRVLQPLQPFSKRQERQFQNIYQREQKLTDRTNRLLGPEVRGGLTEQQIANRQQRVMDQQQRLDRQRASVLSSGLNRANRAGTSKSLVNPNPANPEQFLASIGAMGNTNPTMVAKGGMIKNKAEKKIGTVMKEFKAGKLHSGKDGKVVKNPKQAIAIALSAAGKAKAKPKAKPAAPKKKKK